LFTLATIATDAEEEADGFGPAAALEPDPVAPGVVEVRVVEKGAGRETDALREDETMDELNATDALDESTLEEESETDELEVAEDVDAEEDVGDEAVASAPAPQREMTA
jgi:hypothetical protein